MRRKRFNVVELSTGNVVFSGTKEQCIEKIGFDVVYTKQDLHALYKASTNDGTVHIGTIEELAEIYGMSTLNIYNYKHLTRESDGLHVERLATYK